MEFQADQRSMLIEPEWTPEMVLHEGREPLRDIQITLARAFARILRSGHFALRGCANVEQYARGMGYGSWESRRYVLVGQALEAWPELEARLRAGEIVLDAAVELGRVASDATLWASLPAEDRARWLEHATTQRVKNLRRMVSRSRAEARAKEPVVQLELEVTQDTQEDFERARVIASRKKEKTLTHGETLDEVTQHYLDCFDPLRQEHDGDDLRQAARRLKRRLRTGAICAETPSRGDPSTGTRSTGGPSTGVTREPSADASSSDDGRHSEGELRSEHEDSMPQEDREGDDPSCDPTNPSCDPTKRHIPRAVQRLIRRRANDRCEYPGCMNDIHLQFAHIKAHRHGGSRPWRRRHRPRFSPAATCRMTSSWPFSSPFDYAARADPGAQIRADERLYAA